MKDRCTRCMYRGNSHGATEGLSRAHGCDYITITGRSRLAQVYKALDVQTLTEEAARWLSPRWCPFFEPGKRKMCNRPAIRRKDWDEQKALALWQEGRTDREIAEAVGTSMQNICNWRIRRRYRCNRERGNDRDNPSAPAGHLPFAGEAKAGWKNRASRERAEEIKEMTEQGLGAKEIAARIGITRAGVEWYQRKIRGGAKKPPRKLIDEETLRRMVADGLSDAEIAEKLGVKEKSVQNKRNLLGIKRKGAKG